jgi:acyl-CoA reductase-like NAD-dependent aldehyde dehydrogenase
MDMNKIELETKLYINGAFVEAKSGKKIKVINPSTGEVITEVS